MRNRVSWQGKRSHSLGGAVLAFGALIVALVAVPILLISEGGSPIPRDGLHRLRVLAATHQGFDTRIVTSWMVHGALVLAWVTWAWMVVCIFIEIHSWATGRTPMRLPGSRTMQALAACLVGTSLATISIRTTLPPPTPVQRASMVASAPRSSGSTDLRVIDDYGFRPLSLEPQMNPQLATSHSNVEVRLTNENVRESEDVPVPQPIHTVSGRETLWSIAEDHLGSARRWRELATLNYSVPQYDGGSLTESHWIRPGWRLVLPSPLTTSPGQETAPESATSATELSTLRTSQHAGADVGSPTSNRGTGGPTDWIAEVQRAGEAPLPLVGAGLLGAGVVSLLSRMRRTQQRRRSEGSLIRLPGPTLAPMERRLRRGDGQDTLRAIEESLKLFRQVCIEMGTKVPIVRGIEAHSDEIELVVDRPMDSETVRHPFEVRPGRTAAFIAKEEIPNGLAGSHNPFPTLVTIGSGPEGPQLVNLEATGSVAVVGDPTDCEDAICAVALEMATSYWAGQFDLVVVGFGNELTRFDRVLGNSDLEMVIDQVHYRRLNGEALLSASSYESFCHARVFEDSDTWDPLIVVCGPGIGGAARAELLRAASDPRIGTAIVALGPGIPSSQIWNVSGKGQSFTTDIFGSPTTSQRITPAEIADIGSLVDTARNYESVDFRAQPYAAMSIPVPTQHFEISPRIQGETTESDLNGKRSEMNCVDIAGTSTGSEAIEVVVSVLGPVEIHGAEHEFTRAWAKELVVYLAMHPNGVSNDAWATALWPDRLMASSSLHSTASVARRSLGHGREGQDHLPKAHGRLRLAESVSTDWAQFLRLSDGNSLSNWRRAMELIRGRLFDGIRSSDWPILEGIAPAMEATIVDVAGRLAGAYLQQGDARGAEWAARKALQVSPYDERLYRMLLRAADTAGNPAGVESVMSELVRLVADEVEPFDSVHPSTVELYQSLSRRQSMATSQR